MGEAGGGLEAGFEGVDGVEGEVNCGTCYGASLETMSLLNDGEGGN